MNFRLDINGLRAYAVLAVIIFHYNKDWLPGGFSGVDVFFVISGYLMTGIIFQSIEKNNFSLSSFYESRIKRIIPALLFMVFILIVFTLPFLSLVDSNQLLKHSSGSLLFISNFMYWDESGYFDADAINKFLLHTWSLAVEWQFYILYPILIIFLYKILNIEKIKKVLIFLTIISIIFSIYSSIKWPSASYFLFPARMWEMLLGGLAFLYPLKIQKNSISKYLCYLGFSLIFLSFFIVSEKNSWPGYLALIPTLGAFLIIQSNANSIFNNNFLSQKIGNLSYSLYIYHWPILVINNKFDLDLNFISYFILVLILSVISYFFIEKKKFNPKIIVTMLLIFNIIFFGLYSFYKSKINSFSDENYKISNILGHNIKLDDKVAMNWSSLTLNDKTNSSRLVLFGDSNAAHYTYGITASSLKPKVDLQWVPSCLNLDNFTTKVEENWQDDIWLKSCQNNSIKNREKDVVLISHSWSGYDLDNIVCKNVDCKKSSDFTEILGNGLRALKDNYNNSTIVIIGQVPAPKKSMVDCFKDPNNRCPAFYDEISSKILERNNFLEKFSQQNNIIFINPSDALCNKNNQCKYSENGYSIYFDDRHLSAYGSKVVWNYIEEQLINKGLLTVE